MIKHGPREATQTVDKDWVSFPGGELEGKRPKARCHECRQKPKGATTLCFQCYRAEIERQRAIMAAGELDTASDARFQYILPLEPVNTRRLAMLRTERMAARSARQGGQGGQGGSSRFVDKRRQAQIAARHALQRIAAFPKSWLPFVASR
jgi:hypothetical protein